METARCSLIIAFIGLGSVGAPMRGRLVGTGSTVDAFDLNAGRIGLVKELAYCGPAGVLVADSTVTAAAASVPAELPLTDAVHTAFGTASSTCGDDACT